MHSLVLNKSLLKDEGFPTVAALTRPFSSVNLPVLIKTRFVLKGHPTFATLMRCSSSVDSLVLKKPFFVDVGLLTLTALMKAFSGVSALLLRELDLSVAGLPMLAALTLLRVRKCPAPPASMRMLSTGDGLLLEKARDTLEILLGLFTGENTV